ncbi:MAG TPA: hypothetical protein VFX58_02445 [Chitinophagaceae bacterium]|nr:hypothetical protein [Chitinophagaceae bacterium]
MNFGKNYRLTLAKSALVILVSAFVFIACKKEKNEDPVVQASPVTGYWVGKYTTTGFIGHSNYAMLIKPGGQVRVYDLDTKTDTLALSALAKVDGVWSLNGTTLQTTYNTGTKTVNTTATINAAFNNMNGTWAFDGAMKGTITLSK